MRDEHDPYGDFIHEDFLIPKPHLRGQRLRVWRGRIERHVDDIVGGLTTLVAVLLFLAVREGLITIHTGSVLFFGVFALALCLLVLEVYVSAIRDWRKKQ